MTEPKPGADDVHLTARARDGDQEAFAILVERYSGRIYTLVAGLVRDRDEAEDVVQEVFFKVYRKLPSFEGKSSFYTWLYRVALNTATDQLKKRRGDRSQTIEDFQVVDVEVDGDAPGDDLRRADLRRAMVEAIASLPAKYRNILVLREYEDCSYEDIAAILQCSKGTVESRLFRARARLKDKLKGFSLDET